MKITGKVVYQDIGTGIWGIIDKKGNQWEVVNMPKSLQVEGKQVSVTATEDDSFSIFMWGTPVIIVSH
jgi:hypothetical protein